MGGNFLDYARYCMMTMIEQSLSCPDCGSQRSHIRMLVALPDLADWIDCDNHWHDSNDRFWRMHMEIPYFKPMHIVTCLWGGPLKVHAYRQKSPMACINPISYEDMGRVTKPWLRIPYPEVEGDPKRPLKINPWLMIWATVGLLLWVLIVSSYEMMK